jgi:hypothetical protein
MAYLRNPLAWYKRYVELVYDTPSSPSGIVGRAAHTALQHYYSGIEKEGAVELGLESLRNVSDFEINFGKSGKTKLARKKKRGILAGRGLFPGAAAALQSAWYRSKRRCARKGLAAAY